MWRLFELAMVLITLAWGLALIAFTAAGAKALWFFAM